MENIILTDSVKNKLLNTVKEERNTLQTKNEG
jgi:hypothetical protein